MKLYVARAMRNHMRRTDAVEKVRGRIKIHDDTVAKGTRGLFRAVRHILYYIYINSSRATGLESA